MYINVEIVLISTLERSVISHDLCTFDPKMKCSNCVVAPRSCDLLNGECEQECFTDVLNNTRCRCMSGFVISTDERACQQSECIQCSST